MLFSGYQTAEYYDEMFETSECPRPSYFKMAEGLGTLTSEVFTARSSKVSAHYAAHGITFGHGGREETFPFDLVPRVIERTDWDRIEAGLAQRVTALDRFLADVYGPRHAVRDGVVPNSLIMSCGGYLRGVAGITPPGDRHIHLAGIDMVRDDDGEWLVLEDNLRNPSGLSYVIQNRAFMRRLLPEAFAAQQVASVDGAALALRDAITAHSPEGPDATVIVLSPGPANSAYSEHAYLAQQMGAELVDGRDLVVRDRCVYMSTTRGLRRVHVIYRRIDDDYLDPVALRSDTLLGVAGLIQAYRDGNVVIANTPGNGVADDKALYIYVPDLIRYFLGEEPILGQVPTLTLDTAERLDDVLSRLDTLVVKAVDGAGGYGLLIGPHATPAERSAFADQVRANPGGYIAQDVVKLSRAPVFVNGGFAGRHVDLRPFVMYGESPSVVPGGLTRVALREGSLVVNSSQGGGSKDTWIVDDNG